MQYGPSEEYTRHVDYYNRDERFFGNNIEKFGGQRIKTALLYLTEATGGETVFPKALKENDVGKASCAKKCAPVSLITSGRVPALRSECSGQGLPDRRAQKDVLMKWGQGYVASTTVLDSL